MFYGHFGRIVLQPVTDESIDRLMGCLDEGPDLLASWEKEHREEKQAAVENLCLRCQRIIQLSAKQTFRK